ncbi:MAG: hypothetical protein ABIJ22_02695 [Patescibacteria group bacterium]
MKKILGLGGFLFRVARKSRTPESSINRIMSYFKLVFKRILPERGHFYLGRKGTFLLNVNSAFGIWHLAKTQTIFTKPYLRSLENGTKVVPFVTMLTNMIIKNYSQFSWFLVSFLLTSHRGGVPVFFGDRQKEGKLTSKGGQKEGKLTTGVWEEE